MGGAVSAHLVGWFHQNNSDGTQGQVPLGLPNVGNTCHAASALTAFWCNKAATEPSVFLGDLEMGKQTQLLSGHVRRTSPPCSEHCGSLVRLVWGSIGGQRDVAEHHNLVMEGLWREATEKSSRLASMMSRFAQVQLGVVMKLSPRCPPGFHRMKDPDGQKSRWGTGAALRRTQQSHVLSKFCKKCRTMREMECHSHSIGQPPKLLVLSWDRVGVGRKNIFVDQTRTHADNIVHLRCDGERVVEHQLESIVRHVGSSAESGCCKFDDSKVNLQKQEISAKNNKTVFSVHERKECNVQQPSHAACVSGLEWVLEQTVGTKTTLGAEMNTLGKLASTLDVKDESVILEKAQNLVRELRSTAQAGTPVLLQDDEGNFFGLTKKKLVTEVDIHDADEGLVVSRTGVNCLRARVATKKRKTKRKKCHDNDRVNKKSKRERSEKNQFRHERRPKKPSPPVHVKPPPPPVHVRWCLMEQFVASAFQTPSVSKIVRQHCAHPMAEDGHWKPKICRCDEDVEFAIEQHTSDNLDSSLPLSNGDSKRVMTELSKLKSRHPFLKHVTLVNSTTKRRLREHVDSDAHGNISNIVGITSLPPRCRKQHWHTDFQVTSELATVMTANDLLVPLNGLLAVDACRVHFRKGSHKVILQHALKKNGHFCSRSGDGLARVDPSLLQVTEEQCEEVTVQLDEGDVLLFSSPLVHSGSCCHAQNNRMFFEIDLKKVKRPENSLFLFTPHNEEIEC
eukprot:jgi/Bigna1/75413/fgenesh1_pg.34_\